ncbi:MAG TPA: rhomboid family intramembrane serine protease [Bacillota bacterium]|nr:rhomboid family intramembrane serine protease [Bacillota bacterium]
MIPLRDSVPARKFPLVNIIFIIINVVVFIYQQTLPEMQWQQFVLTYGMVPARLTGGVAAFLSREQGLEALAAGAFPLISANFLHGGWLHLIGNMVYLWVFGDNIEGRLGHLRYLFVYLLMGAASQLCHVVAHPLSAIPLVGASGAIAGVLGAYFILFPHSRVLTLLPLGFFITFVHIPAVIFLALWFVLQLLNATLAAGVQPVAWWAHVGGFVIGAIVGLKKLKGRPRVY